MSKTIQMILLALGLSVVIAFVGCSSDDDEDTVAPPGAPANVAAGLVAPSVARITWSASVLDEAPDGYRIERRTVEGTYSLLTQTGVDVLEYNDSTLAAGTAYVYQVGAYNAGGVTFSDTRPEVTTETYQQLLEGIWDATNEFDVLGADLISFDFRTNGTYRRFENYTLDADIWEEGTFTAAETSVEFHATSNDEGTIDTTYSWNYEMNFTASGMTVEHDYNEGSTYDVEYVNTDPPF